MQKIAWHAANIMNDIRGAVAGRSAKRATILKLLGSAFAGVSSRGEKKEYTTVAAMDAAAIAHNKKVLDDKAERERKMKERWKNATTVMAKARAGIEEI